jgi:lipopolysaccharide/colanic/teichoic acid biosynthesis glycosyltransferase
MTEDILQHQRNEANASSPEVSLPPVAWWRNYPAKRAMDLIVLLLLAPLVIPLAVTIVLAIKLDSSGPAIFQMKRVGFANKEYVVWQFRTMYADHREMRGVPQAARNDPRVTRVGMLLRRTNLDELPRLFSVLLGQMSFVGAYPLLSQEFGVMTEYLKEQNPEMVEVWLKARAIIPSGVNGPSAEAHGIIDTLDGWRIFCQSEIEYAKHCTLLGDLGFILRTLLVPFRGTERSY